MDGDGPLPGGQAGEPGSSQDAGPPGASGPPPAAVAPPEGGDGGTPPPLTDDEIWRVLSSPEALPSVQAVASMLNEQQGAPPGAAAPPAATAPPPAATGQTDLERRVAEGDGDAAIELLNLQRAEQVRQEAAEAATVGARRQVMGELFQVPALQNLTPAEQGKLIVTLRNQGEQAFMQQAIEIAAVKGVASPPAGGGGTPEQQAARAAENAAVASGNQAAALNLPGATAPGGPPPIDFDAGKSATDVLDDYFAWAETDKQ